MGRKPLGPWWREDKQCYYVKIRSKRHRLDPDKDEAERMFHELMGKPAEKKPVADSVVAVIDNFLGWVSENRASATYDWYMSFLNPFANAVKHLRVSQLQPHHVTAWLAKQPGWGRSTKRAAITCVKRCFSWAKREGHVSESPVAQMEKPEAGKRDIVLSKAEYKQLIDLADDRMNDVLQFAWETGARPQEVYALESRHIQLKNSRIVFPKEESKGKKRPRVIYLNPKALKIVKRLMGNGHIFLNADGEPFTKDSVNSFFNRVQTRTGKRTKIEIPEKQIKALIPKLKQTVASKDGETRDKTEAELRCEAKRKLTNKEAKKNSPKLCLYNLRHSFCHRLLAAGVDSLTVSVLMGHANPTMVATTYSHLSRADGHLFDALKKA